MKLGCTWRHDLRAWVKAGSPFPIIFGNNSLPDSSYYCVRIPRLEGTRSCKSPCHYQEDCFNPEQKANYLLECGQQWHLDSGRHFLWSGCFSWFPRVSTLAPVCSLSSDDLHMPCCLELPTILNPQLEILNMFYLNMNFWFFSWRLNWNWPSDLRMYSSVPLFLDEWSHNQLLNY